MAEDSEYIKIVLCQQCSHSFNNKSYVNKRTELVIKRLYSLFSAVRQRNKWKICLLCFLTSTKEEDHQARVEEAVTRMLVCALKTAENPHNTRAWLNPTEVGPFWLSSCSPINVSANNHFQGFIFFLRLRQHPMKSTVATWMEPFLLFWIITEHQR